jgi:hypothetical protein
LRWRQSGLINDRGVGAIRFEGYVFAKRSLFGFDPLRAEQDVEIADSGDDQGVVNTLTPASFSLCHC